MTAANITGLLIGLVQTGATMSAGRTLEQQAKVEGKRIELQATREEVERNERLAAALATQNARAGTKGIRFSGSQIDVLEQSIAKSERATQRSAFDAQRQKMAIKQKAQSKRKGLEAGAELSLLKDIGSFSENA